MTPKAFEAMLADYGWTFHPIEDPSVLDTTGRSLHAAWVTGFDVAKRTFPLRITMTATYTLFRVEPLLDFPVAWEKWPNLLITLFRLNDESRLVKLAINDNGDLVLSLEIMNEGFGCEALATALGVIAYYAEECSTRVAVWLAEQGAFRDPSRLS